MTYGRAIFPSRAGILRCAALLATALLLSGCALFDYFSTAEEDERQAIERSLRKVADAAQQTHDYAAAAQHFERLHEKDPKDLSVTLGLARNLRYSGRPKRAKLVLEQALAGAAANPQLLAEYGRALIAAGEPESAISPLNKAMAIEAGNWRTLSALGIAHDQLGRHEAARRSYEKAQAMSPENVTILNNLALSWALSGRLSEAVQMLEAAQRLPGASVQLRQNLALLHGIQGNDKRAYELARLDLPEEAARENMRYYVSLREGVQSGAALPSGADQASYSIQVGAYASPALALEAWRAMQGKHPDLLSTYQVEVFDKKDISAAPYVVWVGPMKNIKAASRLCQALRERSAECLVVMQ